jgi:hypothetical protein
MGLLKALGIGFLALVILALALFIANFASYYGKYFGPTGTHIVMGYPAGLVYRGPPTTALAGYYCITNIDSSNGFSIQLDAGLDNGLGVQDAYGTFVYINNAWQTAFLDNVWSKNNNGAAVLLHASNPSNDVINAPCAWLIISIRNGVAYFGYSLDGKSIVWYDSYPVGANYIIADGQTSIVLAGASNGEQAQLNSVLAYIALFYWNGTGWAPAPVSANSWLSGTVETVNHAWVYANGSCGGVVSWPSPVNVTQCPGPPNFNP